MRERDLAARGFCVVSTEDRDRLRLLVICLRLCGFFPSLNFTSYDLAAYVQARA